MNCYGTQREYLITQYSPKADLTILFGRRGPLTSRNWVRLEKKGGTSFPSGMPISSEHIFIFFPPMKQKYPC